MSCENCAGYMAWNDQLQRGYSDLLKQEENLVEMVRLRERTIEALTRELREAKDELRIRREVTGYLPHLDYPLDASSTTPEPQSPEN